MMKQSSTVLCLLLTMFLTGLASTVAAQDKPDEKPTFASVLDRQFSNMEKVVVPAADAMPDDKYGFTPTQGEYKGVRDFGFEVKHIATANYAFGAAILGEKPPVDLTGPNGPPNVKSKAEIMKYLTDSFAYAHKAINSITEANVLELTKGPFGPNKTTRLAMATSLIAHPYDHYGQMVEYLRMNNIVPPASRK